MKAHKIFAILLGILFTGCAVIPQYLPEEKLDIDAGIIRYIDMTKPMIALTFDDGPYKHTDELLDLLELHGVQATFFVLGEQVEKWQDTVIRAANNGNEIAGHTWSHLSLVTLSNQAIKDTIQNTTVIIEQVTGIPVQSFFRPPFGHVDQRVASIAGELGYAIVHWTVDIEDWRVRDADAVYEAIMRYAAENAVFVLHDIVPSTVEAMKRVIPALITKGYRLVPVSQVLSHVHGELRAGKVYGTPGIVN